MNLKLSLAGLTGLILLTGCIPSLNPLYTEADRVYEPAAVGTWNQTDSKATWEFARRDEKSYDLLYTDDNGRQGRFVAHLVELDGERFLDIFPDEVDFQASGFYKFHLVPIHTVYRVRQIEPNLELAAIDFKWLEKHLNENPDSIQVASFNGRKLISAPTEEVQAFVVRHKDMFTAEFNLERQTDK